MIRAVDIIRKKRDGDALSADEIEIFVAGATTGAWPPYQASSLLMAIVLRGMNAEETARLCAAMVSSGVKLDLSNLPRKGGVRCSDAPSLMAQIFQARGHFGL